MYDYIKMFMHYDLTLSPLALRINRSGRQQQDRDQHSQARSAQESYGCRECENNSNIYNILLGIKMNNYNYIYKRIAMSLASLLISIHYVPPVCPGT